MKPDPPADPRSQEPDELDDFLVGQPEEEDERLRTSPGDKNQ